MADPQQIHAAATKFAEEKHADVFLFSAGIERETAKLFCAEVTAVKHRKKNAAVILTTSGGDPDAAFLIARCFQRHYKETTVYIFGPCKSAGTLICVGATHIVIADSGELGPLDIQLGKEDELFKRSSGLDLTESVKYLKDLSWELFKQHFVALKRGSSITTKTAAEIAESLSASIISPIAGQIDPLKLGEVQRAMRITRDYGRLLNPTLDLDKLIASYPSHSFVIDREQAQQLFPHVRKPDSAESDLHKILLNYVLDEFGIVKLLSLPQEPKKHENAPTNGEPQTKETTAAPSAGAVETAPAGR